MLSLSHVRAAEILRAEARKSTKDSGDPEWLKRIERLSEMCEESGIRTHLAFMGTALLAKSIDKRADLYWIKPRHAKDAEYAFSARTLAHNVLVPLAAELGFSLGVTGREPLNNQPYFRMTRLDDGTPVHPAGRPAFDYMLKLIADLQKVPSEDAARGALRAYIAVRGRYQNRYTDPSKEAAVTPASLLVAISTFVSEKSEGGKRAQAVVAGLMDVVVGADRVISDRINDPSRKTPGDVVVMGTASVEKAIEVKDKLTTKSDVQLFAKKCVDMGARDAAYVMVAAGQAALDEAELQQWAAGFGIGLTLFNGWSSIIPQALFWSPAPKPDAAVAAALRIRERLVGVEAEPASVQRWEALVSK